MAKAWMFSGVSRNPSAILSLLFLEEEPRQRAGAQTHGISHSCCYRFLPSYRKTVSLASFHWGLWALIRERWAVCLWSSGWDNQGIKSVVFFSVTHQPWAGLKAACSVANTNLPSLPSAVRQNYLEFPKSSPAYTGGWGALFEVTELASGGRLF